MDLCHKTKNSFLWLLFIFLLTVKAAGADDPYWFIISINQTVTQSSTAVNGEPEKAVDGKQGTCSLTPESKNPYLMIDFGREIFPPVARIAVASNYQKVKIKIGNNPDCASNPVVKSYTNLKDVVNTVNLYERGRYFCIHALGTTALSICQLFIFQTPLGGIAYKKPVTLPNGDLSGDNSRRAVNRRLNDLSWTPITIVDPWTRLDLLDSFFIRELIIITHPNYGIDYLTIKIGSSLVNEGRSNPLCTKREKVDIGGKSFFCRMRGRYVILTRKTVDAKALNVAELFVNPSHQENLAAGKICVASSNTQGVPLHTSRKYLTNMYPPGGYITTIGTSGNWLRVDLVGSFPIARIFMENVQPTEYIDQMVDFELRVGDSLTDDGNSNSLCLSGLQSLLRKTVASFYCEPRVTGRYVNVNQKTVDKNLALAEIAVYSEAAPEIKREKARYIWSKNGVDVDILCEAYGYPTPVVFWAKDGVTLNTGSNGFRIASASFNDSGTYECWADNTHGRQYKPVEVSITSDLRPCVESKEIHYDLGATGVAYPDVNQEFFGDKWYRFYDSSAKQYLQMSDKVPHNSACSGWINGGHPGVKDGVIERNVCVKENGVDCKRQYSTRVRSCGAYYVYNLLSSIEAKGFSYCFTIGTMPPHHPAISFKAKENYALINHIFQVETGISDSSHCLLMCSLAINCPSFNFSSKENICELNSSTKDKHPTDFSSRNGYGYYMNGKGLLLSRKLGDL